MMKIKAFINPIQKRAMLIDAVILKGEEDRLLGWAYPDGDPRGKHLNYTPEKRVEYLRKVLLNDYSLPKLGIPWKSGSERIIRDGINIQNTLDDSSDYEISLRALMEHLTNLPYYIPPAEKSVGLTR